MLRLAVPFILLLLTLFAGAVWLIDIEPKPLDPAPAKEQQAARQPAPDAAESIIKDTADALAPGGSPASGDAPAFDIARIDPQGTSVFAGRAEPNTYVTITADGAEIGTAEVDDNGEWTFTTDKRIANPDAKLALFRASAPPTTVAAKETESAASTAPATSAGTATSREAPAPKTAGAVASNLLKNLEGMVAEAREEQQQEQGKPAAPAESPPPAAATDSAHAPEIPEPTLNAPAPATPTDTASRLPEPGPSPSPVTEAPAAPQVAAAIQPVAPSAQPSTPAAEIARPTASSITVPVPVTFIYNEATLTSEGQRAAGLLLEYLQIKDFPRITLTGHADERGSHELNMALSRERLETVAQFLRSGGYQGKLELIPKGKTEPYTGVVRSDFTRDDLYQLDRRVELVITR